MMRIFILGAGYVGTALLAQTDQRFQFVATTTTPEKIPLLQQFASQVFFD